MQITIKICFLFLIDLNILIMSVKRFDENGKELIREYKAITKDGLAGLSHEVGYSASYISQMQNGKRPVSRVLAWGLEKAIALEKFMKSNST